MKKCNIDDCSIYRCQKLLKHKWVPIIIFCIKRNIVTFNGLLNQIAFISNSQLANTLKLLVDEKILIQNNNGYTLTLKGEDLNQIIELMRQFDEN
ncbi:MAG: winged helix-turn-helix transcriptional regulator [Mycoplasmatales bacterium]